LWELNKNCDEIEPAYRPGSHEAAVTQLDDLDHATFLPPAGIPPRF
jgi:hypothetical protein